MTQNTSSNQESSACPAYRWTAQPKRIRRRPLTHPKALIRAAGYFRRKSADQNADRHFVFVADAYTRRILAGHSLLPGTL
jgi:endonuclease III-like uncharacterized protein